MRLLAFALLASLLLAGCSSSGGGSTPPPAGAKLGDSGDSMFATRYHLNASLEPPITRYFVVTTSNNPMLAAGGGTLPLENGSYTWTWSNSNGCGRFEPLGSSALWHHGDDTDCGHDSPLHEATVMVVIGGLENHTSSTGYGTCEFTRGSATGQGEACFVSSVAPEGQAPARDTSIPSPAWAAPVALMGIALLLARSRARR